jgi:hypothetical protein
VVRLAFEERTPVPRRRRPWPLAAVVLLAAALVVAFLSPSGHAVFERVRRAVGVEHAAPALFSLPAPGRLLVVSPRPGGVWLVHADGLKRRVGPFDDAEWSPHGIYLVATTADELLALEANGDVHWTLARRRPASPRWEGTYTDTRIAYLSAGALRVVAGNGTGDHLLARRVRDVAPAWDPALLHTLAYYARGAILLRHDDGRLVWRRPTSVLPDELAWSSDGRYLAVFSARRVVVLDRSGRIHRTISELRAQRMSGAFAPGSHRLAIDLRLPGRSEVHLVDVDRPGSARLLFAGPGAFGQLAWSPNGSWLLVTWPTADQWVFLHGTRAHAVANIRAQFQGAGRAGLTLEVAGRWCCG